MPELEERLARIESAVKELSARLESQASPRARAPGAGAGGHPRYPVEPPKGREGLAVIEVLAEHLERVEMEASGYVVTGPNQLPTLRLRTDTVGRQGNIVGVGPVVAYTEPENPTCKLGSNCKTSGGDKCFFWTRGSASLLPNCCGGNGTNGGGSWCHGAAGPIIAGG